MRGLLIFLGILLVLGGGAVAATQYAPVDLSFLAQAPGVKTFLLSPTALYAGGGAGGFGLLLMIFGVVAGGKKKDKPAKARKTAAARDARAKPETAKSSPAKAQPAKTETAKADAIFAPAPPPAKPAPAPKSPPQPVAAGAMASATAAPTASTPPAPTPAPKQASAPTTQPPPRPPVSATPAHLASAKPTASAQPPAPPAGAGDPRLANRKRVQDLVTINDALKTYREKHGAYPKAGALAGFPDRGTAWIPGLAPDFLKELPRDPAMSGDKTGPQYVYVSDGADYKLLAQGVSLVGGTNVEVLGVRIDMTRQPTPENAAFGFWTPGFASA